MRYEAVFFDLDGTLIGLKIHEFLPDYLAAVRQWSQRVGDGDCFMRAFDAAVRAMIGGQHPHMTNEETFFSHLLRGLPHLRRDEVQVLFDAFYREVFPQMCRHCTPIEGAREMVRGVRRAGLRPVLATNPLFPRTAVVQRLRWGNLDPRAFEYITSYENSRYCKPDPRYFRDLIDICRLRPDAVLMVGNDPVEDLAAGELGLDTFLVCDYRVERGEWVRRPTYRGSLRDLRRMLIEESGADATRRCSNR